MNAEDPRPRGPRRTVLLWTLVVGVITTLIAVYAVRGGPGLRPAPPAPPAPPLEAGQTLVLPHDPPELPPGPNREQFIAACTICHSARIITNQPRFPRSKWKAEVRKMVDVFGAPITPDEEPRYVDYLMVLRGAGE